MYITEILFISMGLAMDAFAVSISNGVIEKKISIKYPLKIASSFGLFQAFMPIIGWIFGIYLKIYISSIDHWIAFSFLSFIGLKMIVQSVNNKVGEKRLIINNKVLFMQSLATSIDAFAIGTSLAFLNFPILLSSLIIGTVTFIISFCGVIIGKKCGFFLKSKAEILGGLILIGIGLKILIEHLI